MKEKSILILGLGRMGSGIAKRLSLKGFKTYVYDRHYEKAVEISRKYKNIIPLKELQDFKIKAKGKKIIWIMLPHGDVTQTYIEKSRYILSKGDIIIDGGNSKWEDSKKNYRNLKKSGINFLDAGVSGGIWGERNGYCIMVGGDKEVFEYCEDYFKALSTNKGYLYCGDCGSGHFVKMVHNGIEYAMMQAYAEGFELIGSFDGVKAKKSEIAGMWNRGSVIRSWLLELGYLALKENEELSDIKGYVEDSGEGRWTVEYAISKSIPCETITASLFRRFRSRKENPFSERFLAALREKFGGHKVIR
ncbi:MAG TPA: decarboxylating 6-phosphogluconate dehydrogenase [Elusimicrobiales bacterium]|nr:decarboxylating 6-phosphogluconate dehydrogenase [Elusimicrobiales bacterium]HOL62085.1 decarboxylating 6-phosphogluconate dehydrogenase [Elusimicrobiales bacterium]HPO94413.1 decarboxylating 6-phosphogluconate dehydrogenase [Elusimicrobiales bacterium]